MLLVKSIWSQECSINRDFKLAVPKKKLLPDDSLGFSISLQT